MQGLEFIFRREILLSNLWCQQCIVGMLNSVINANET